MRKSRARIQNRFCRGFDANRSRARSTRHQFQFASSTTQSPNELRRLDGFAIFLRPKFLGCAAADSPRQHPKNSAKGFGSHMTIPRFAATTALCLTLVLIAPAVSHPGATPQDDADRRIEKIISQMTLEEKIDYIGGSEAPKAENMYVRGVPRLSVPAFKMSDGPLGVRTWGPSME